jgi:tetratricopeptide (TPR) repeat protein
MTTATAALLDEAARLHSQGALAEATSRFQKVLQSEPDHALALYHLAVIGCQQGRFAEGIDLARRSLASDPRQPRAYNILGMAMSRLGRHEEALAAFDNAIAERADFADAHGNRGGALLDLGRVADAVASLQRAVALAPDSAGDWLSLGTALHRFGRHDDAIASFDRALTLQPTFPQAHLNRGNVLHQLRRHEEALASYDRALAITRRYPEALHGRALALLGLGRIEGAVANFEEALELAPNRPDTLGQLVEALLARGEMHHALKAVLRVLAVADDAETRALFVACISNRKLSADPGGVREQLIRALLEPWDRSADLAMPAASLVKLNPAIKYACARAAQKWPQRLVLEDLSGGRLAAVVDDRLLRALLETVPVCDVELERCLTGMRSILLDAAAEGPGTGTEDGLMQFFCALARQSFINEYVFDTSSHEQQQVRKLAAALARAIAAGGAVPVHALLAVACYQPLHSVAGAGALIERSWTPAVAAVVAQQVHEPRDEQNPL